jgi:hypothetical protein
MAVTNIDIEMRVTELEAKVQRLEQELAVSTAPKTPWWEQVVGAFADDPDFLEAMRLGREYRESLRPKPPRRPRSTKQQKA